MISSIIKRIQKTVSTDKPIEGDALDDLVAENLKDEPLPKVNSNSVPPATTPDPPKEELKLEPVLPPQKPTQNPKPAAKPEAVVAVVPSDLLREFFIAESKKWIGVKETATNKGPEVEKFQKAIDGKASGEPWCLGFVWFCIIEAEKMYQKRFGSEMKSWLYRTEHCLTMWNLSPKEARLTKPKPGCVAVWQHIAKDGIPTAKGHVGIVVKVLDGTFMQTVEGNTNNDTVVQDEGDGVYLLKRNYVSPSGSKKLVGFLKPWKEF